MKYAIAVDSSSDLTCASQLGLAESGDIGFGVASLKIQAGDRHWVDDADLDVAEMATFLSTYKGRSGTACPSVGVWLESFGDAEYVFTVAITSNLSGCHNAALQAKEIYEEQHPDRRVCCLDSLSTGPEMVLIAEKLRELIDAGLDFDTVEKEVREYMKKTHLLFSLESLDNLAKNGRVSKVVAKAAGILGIRVVGKASDVGTLQQMHKCRGEKKALATILEEMEKHGFTGGKVRIAHGLNEAGAKAMLDVILAKYPDIEATIVPFTGLCCFYAERGGIMVGFEG